MPTVAYFLGISVRMFFNDHEPPHFHVRYQGFRARVRSSDGGLIDGRLSPTVTRLVNGRLYHESLMRNWRAARSDRQLERIAGLE
ncbi:MAG: DUF4160 domain-containing protein [Xanthobacteraceae bacterium]